MLFHFNLKSSLLLLFFAHGLLFFLLLLVKGVQKKSASCIWLSIFVFLSTLYISPFMLGYAGWYSRQPYRDILFYLPLQQLFLLPPVLFFYIKSLLDRSFVFRRKDWLHFIPAAIYLIYSAAVFIVDKIIMEQPYFYQDGKDKDFAPSYQAAGFLWLIFYCILSLRYYFRYRAMTYQLTSFADSILFRWVQRFLLAMLLLLFLRGAFFIVNPEWAGFGRKFWYYLCFSVLLYFISFSGYINSVRTAISLQSPFGTGPAKPPPVPADDEAPAEIIADEAPADEVQAPDLPLPDLDLEEWKAKLDKLMQENKIFQNPTLTLADVAGLLQVAPKRVSQVINQGFGVNFNDYVNQHRTKEVISKLESGEHSLQTLLGIAYDCGFNSKSTFNRAFRKQTGLSPREYLQKISGQ
jgi:AraC-like DNA-binding protein